MSTYVNVAGAYQKAKAISIKDGGVWRSIKNAWVKKNGAWAQVFQSIVNVTYDIFISQDTNQLNFLNLVTAQGYRNDGTQRITNINLYIGKSSINATPNKVRVISSCPRVCPTNRIFNWAGLDKSTINLYMYTGPFSQLYLATGEVFLVKYMFEPSGPSAELASTLWDDYGACVYNNQPISGVTYYPNCKLHGGGYNGDCYDPTLPKC